MKNEVKTFLVLSFFIAVLPVVIAASVTPATGGTNISSATVGGNYTALTGPVISEAATADIGLGNIILVVPSGFEFDANASVTVLITRLVGGGGANRNINNVAGGTSVSVTSINSTHIVFIVTDVTSNSVTNSLTWQGVRVRPTAALPLASGNISLSGNSSIVAVASGSAMGALIETDTTPPVVTVPANIVAEATSSSGAVVNFSANATDNVDGAIVPSCMPSQGSTFPLGITTVTCNATDNAGNTGTNSFNVTVQDTTPPVVTVPANIFVNASNSSGAIVTFSTTANDIVNGSLIPICNPASGSTFPINTTIVICNATDSSNNTGTNTFNITVQDAPPVVNVPVNIVAEAANSSGAIVNYTANATDTVDGSLIPSCTPSSGSVFSLGTTNISCSAIDSSGNIGANTFNITVQDTTPPAVNVPANIIVEAANSSGAIVSYSTNATDSVDGNLISVCAPLSGSIFPLGITSVTCNATDNAGNTGTNSFNITVQDTTPPTVNVPANIVAEATGSSGASVTFSATASDTVDGSLTPICSPASGSVFPLGTTNVACNATDNSTNTGTNSFNITIQDTTPPTVNVPATIISEATNSSGASVSYTANATDTVNGSLTPVCTPLSGSTFPLGVNVVNCSAVDSYNNTGVNSFNISVQDTTPPSITVPANIIAEATNSSGAVVNFSVNVSDLVDASPSLVCVPASGSVFAIGILLVNCTANDFSGMAATSSFNVTVADTTAPLITAPANISMEATGNLTVVSLGVPVVFDAVDASPTVINDSPASFPVGITIINYTVFDDYNNSANATQSVEINDTTPPNITMLGSNPVQVVLGSVYVDAGATADDIVDGNLTGSILVVNPVNTSTAGTYFVTYDVNDTAGNPAVTVNRTVNVVASVQSGGASTNGYQPFVRGFVSGGVIPPVSPFTPSQTVAQQSERSQEKQEVAAQPAIVSPSEPAPSESTKTGNSVPKITGAFGLNVNLNSPVLWSSIAGAAVVLGAFGYLMLRKKPELPQ